MPPDGLRPGPVLGIDTSAAHCAAALLWGDRIVAERHEPMATGQSERLLRLVEEMLAGAGVHWHDLSAIGVGTGPGNFTGIRIAVSAARGVALALKIPAIGVSSFDALEEGAALISLPAPRGQVWLSGPGREPMLTTDLPKDLRQSGRDVIGAEAERLATATGGRARPAPPLAPAIARIAAQRRGTPQPRPAPLYLRPADAAPPADPPPVILP